MSTETHAPESFVAGDVVSWTFTHPDYSPVLGWGMIYVFVDSIAQALATASGTGESFEITLSTALTGTMGPTGTAGDARLWSYQGYVSKGSERYVVDPPYGGKATLRVHPDFAAATGGYDARSTAQKNLEAIDAYLSSKAGDDVSSYSISSGGSSRSLSRMTKTEIYAERDKNLAIVNREKRAERTRRGLRHRGQIGVVFR